MGGENVPPLIIPNHRISSGVSGTRCSASLPPPSAALVYPGHNVQILLVLLNSGSCALWQEYGKRFLPLYMLIAWWHRSQIKGHSTTTQISINHFLLTASGTTDIPHEVILIALLVYNTQFLRPLTRCNKQRELTMRQYLDWNHGMKQPKGHFWSLHVKLNRFISYKSKIQCWNIYATHFVGETKLGVLLL